MALEVLSGSYAFWNDKKIKGEVSLKNKAKHEHVVIVLYFHRLRNSVSIKEIAILPFSDQETRLLGKSERMFSLLRGFSQNM